MWNSYYLSCFWGPSYFIRGGYLRRFTRFLYGFGGLIWISVSECTGRMPAGLGMARSKYLPRYLPPTSNQLSCRLMPPKLSTVQAFLSTRLSTAIRTKATAIAAAAMLSARRRNRRSARKYAVVSINYPQHSKSDKYNSHHPHVQLDPTHHQFLLHRGERHAVALHP